MRKLFAAAVIGLALLASPALSQTTAPDQSGATSSDTAAPVAQTTALPNATEPEPIVPKALEQAISTKLEAIELSWKTLDRAVWVASWLGVVLAVMVGALTFFGFKSLRELDIHVTQLIDKGLDDKLRQSGALVTDLIKSAHEFEKLGPLLEKMKRELVELETNVDSTSEARAFDPLIEYRILKSEIERRHEASRKLRRGDTSIKAEDTLENAEFSRRSAVVFSRLLQAAKDDEAAGKQRLSTVDLFNLAASASEADLDFVSLELMEIAVRQDKSRQPEVEARLIRQRLAASRITRDEAKNSLEAVLRRVNGFDLHLVVSEAFNIALHSADPAAMAKLIETSLDEKLQKVSYVPLVRAELLFMSDAEEDWAQADVLVAQGLDALDRESVEARWYQSSLKQLVKLTADQGRRMPPPTWLTDSLAFLSRFQGPSDGN